MLCKKVVGMPRAINLRAFYGVYWHSIVTEAPILYRIVSPRTICTEEQERAFNTIKEITKRTSNGHSHHIIPNSLLHMQAEIMIRDKPTPVLSTHSLIGKYASTLPPPSNTEFPETEINSYEYQAHLERISDFLLPGEGIWWHYDEDIRSVIFHDGHLEPKEKVEGPLLNHFRSSIIKSERIFLREQWENCLETEVLLPISKVKIYDEKGDLVKDIIHIKDLVKEFRTADVDDIETTDMDTVAAPEISVNTENDINTGADDVIDDIPIKIVVHSALNTEVTEEDLQSDDSSDLPAVQHAEDKGDIGVTEEGGLAILSAALCEEEKCTTEVKDKDLKSDDHVASQVVPNKQTDRSTTASISSDQVEESTSTHNVKSKSCNASTIPIYKCGISLKLVSAIGHSEKLKQFDKQRSRLKANSQNNTLIADYDKSLTIIQTEVLSVHGKLSNEFKDWEKDFFMPNVKNPQLRL